jgi:hypothetical protein
LHLPPTDPSLEIGDRLLALGPSDKRTMALWHAESGDPVAWLQRGRRPWRACVMLPGADDDLELTRPPIGGVRLRDGAGRTLAAVTSTKARDGRPQTHAKTAAATPLELVAEGALLLVLVTVLLDELSWGPRENRASGDITWETRTGTFDGLFGGGGGSDGGGGGGGGGDGGGGGGGSG